MINSNRQLSLKKQQGSTLFVSLVLLLAISIISLAGMRTSLLELVIANNKQQFSNTFQAAEEVINSRLATLNLTIASIPTAGDVIGAEVPTTVTNEAGHTTAEVRSNVIYRATVPALGWSIGTGKAHHFFIDAVATSAARNAESQHQNGFYVIGP